MGMILHTKPIADAELLLRGWYLSHYDMSSVLFLGVFFGGGGVSTLTFSVDSLFLYIYPFTNS